MGQNASTIGSWSPPITFPLVPVAGAIDPLSGKLLVWSSYTDDHFNQGQNVTQTAYYDPHSGAVNTVQVGNTGHDMFCPGISFDFNGRLVVTGGDSAYKTSIWIPGGTSWTPGHDMNIARGYQSSATLSNGKIFTIGGSWSPDSLPRGGRTGEIYDPTANTWTKLTGADPTPMLTADRDFNGATTTPGYRNDNHAWLFGWKNGYVFQAGPSKAMNWYSTSGSGGHSAAGPRGPVDQMCGPAVMWDAPAGKILAVGGSPDYEQSEAVTNAYQITIGSPGSTASSTYVSNGLWYPRIFANSVVLPTGHVFIVGGQTFGHPFSDANATLTPEIWDPSSGNFFKMAPDTIARNYHSIALLMPNGTVFSGGGGLCGGGCPEGYSDNHFDGRLWTPPYLYNNDGLTFAARPGIASVSSTSYSLGGTASFKVTINPTSGTATFSMIRIGSATHTVNTDQRRAPLPVVGTPSGNTYTLQMPTDPGIATPGYWYVFVIQNGVPSVASTIKITL